jgi:hypothetical protein
VVGVAAAAQQAMFSTVLIHASTSAARAKLLKDEPPALVMQTHALLVETWAA